MKDTIIRVFEEAKKKKKAPEKKEDPNDVARKKRGLTHNVGHMVHAGLGVKGGAGYRGTVVKIDDNHTYIDIGNKRVVKAPHHLVSAHEETNSENRMKVSNIGRPNDPPVNSKGSVLHKTLQIKHKIIDEGTQ